ncbi:MAG TPA: hypothetical protein VF691_12285, partial [Cytophagaceae bacterium]
MPNKLFIFIFILSLQIFQASANQNIEQNLAHADSLFSQQKYTQALDTYNHLLEVENYFNRPMLLKMAFINENIEDHTQALYCLNLLYLKYPHKAILAKMEELAEGEELLGYQYTDSEYFVSLYKKYYLYVMVSLLTLSSAFFIYFLIKYKRRLKLGQWPVV